MKKTLFFTLFGMVMSLVQSVRAEIYSGVAPERENHLWRGSIGFIGGIEGSVHETFRAFYQASGQDAKQALAESYDLDDFGISAPYTVFGLTYERQWAHTAFRWNTLFLSLSASATAKRDYYLGIGDEIGYNGHKYENLKIPSGQEFSADFSGIMTDLTFGYTPFTVVYHDGYATFTPSIDLGLVLILGEYDIDAGKPVGTTVYQNPPVDFVIGGHSSSMIGVGAPTIGLSGEFRAELKNDTFWTSRLGFAYFAYDGSSSPFTSSSHRSKNLDISMLSFFGETGLEFPFQNGTALSLGLRLQWLSVNAEIASKEKDVEAVLAARERFDKSADFDLYTFLAYIGFTY